LRYTGNLAGTSEQKGISLALSLPKSENADAGSVVSAANDEEFPVEL
jgi:hypothetical protein